MVKALPRWPGTVASLVVAGLCLVTLIPLLAQAGAGTFGRADLAALRFTLFQAALSATASVMLAVPLARALARRSFPGRRLLVTLLGAPFLLPVIVAVMGLLVLWGRQGLLNDALAWLGMPRLSIYGVQGVVLAHVFLNVPLVTRLLLQAWEDIPAERFRLAATLNAPVGLLLEWPMLRAAVPGAFAAVFALCLSSFSVVLILGGGPAASTLELAIYQAIRFEADFGTAARLALVQYMLCGAAAFFAFQVAAGTTMGAGIGRPVERWDSQSRGSHLLDGMVIGAAALFLLLPLGVTIWRGLWGLADLPSGVWGAALRSLLVAVVATMVALVLGMALALRASALATIIGSLPLAASPLVLGSGLLLALRSIVPTGAMALPITALVDGLLALPFVLRVLAGPLGEAEARHGRLADALAITGWSRVQIVILPVLRSPLGFAAGLAAALSVGNLGVIALLAGDAEATLPLLMARLMGAYRMEAAAGVGLLILALAFGLFWLCDRLGKADAAS